MPSDTMHVNVNFTNWSQHFTDPEKSLINFFFKNAVVRFYGFYNDGAFDSLYGNIQSPYRLYSLTSGQIGESGAEEASMHFLDMPLSMILKWPCMMISNIMPESPCNLTSAANRLIMCRCNAVQGEDYQYKYSACEEVAQIGGATDSSNAAITFFRGANPNTDTTFRPSAISQSVPLATVNMVNPVGTDLRYDFQLKTDEFRIVTTSDVTHTCYYKIGIVPLNDNTLENILTYLKASERKFCIGRQSIDPFTGVAFNITDSSASGYEPDAYFQEATFNSPNSISSILHKTVFPLVNPSNLNQLYGLLYIELYNSTNNEPLTATGNVSKFQVKQGSSWVDCDDGDYANLAMTEL